MVMKANTQKLCLSALLGLLIGLSAFWGGCAYITGEAIVVETQIIKDITPVEAYALIQNNLGDKDFAVIDVRTPEEYASGHIDKAVNLDYQSETFGDELGKLDRNKTYLVYCRSGKRSAGALDMMKELGFKAVYNMVGGILEWEVAGLPMVK